MMRSLAMSARAGQLGVALVMGLCVITPGTARADDLVEVNRVVVEFDAFGRPPAYHADLYVRISNDVGVPVVVLQERQAKWHLTWGELYMIHLVAWESHRSFEVILADRRAGKGWGVIARTYGVKLGRIVSAAHKSEKAWNEQKTKGGASEQAKGESVAKGKDDPAPKEEAHSGGGKGHGGGGKGRK